MSVNNIPNNTGERSIAAFVIAEQGKREKKNVFLHSSEIPHSSFHRFHCFDYMKMRKMLSFREI
jgi:hypothetical protein